MFCADYVAAFIYHAILTVGTINLFGRRNKKNYLATITDGEKGNSRFDSKYIGEETKEVAIKLAAIGLGLSYPSTISPVTATLIKERQSNRKQQGEEDVEITQFSKHNKGGTASRFMMPICIGLASGLGASASLYPFDFVRGGVLMPGLKRIMSAGSTVPYAGTLFGIYFCFRDQNRTASQMKWAVVASSCAVLAEAPFDHAKRAMLGSTRVMLGAGLLYVPFASLMLVMYDKAAVKLVSPIINHQV